MRRYFFAGILVFLLIILAFWFFLGRGQSDPHTIVLFGNVDVRQVNLGFRVSGRVVEMPFQEGDLVKEGDLMAILDPQPYQDLVTQAQASLASVVANLTNAKQLFERRKELRGDGGVSDEDYQTAEANLNALLANRSQAEASLGVASTNFKDTRVYAPTTGTILTRIREPGTVLNVADPVYTLSILSPVWVRAFVSEPDLGRIYPGMKGEVHTDSGRVYEGHIGFISPIAEFTPKTVETTQLRVDLVYRIRVIADNPDHFLKQGMPVTVFLRHVK